MVAGASGERPRPLRTGTRAVILAGKRALVTGGVGGIGSAIVRLLVAEGAEVVVHDLPQTARAALVASIVPSGRATFIAGDLRDSPTLIADVARIGPLDILVNNAAVDPIGPIESYDSATYDETQAINARAAFLLSQAVVPGMKQRGGGAIVNIMSVTLSGGWSDKVPYVMSKGALLGLTRALAREVGPAPRRYSDRAGAEVLARRSHRLRSHGDRETAAEIPRRPGGHC
jgi:NAD(P)-dependent dehydrogenase (short-subunit alcohol dehydrogenase family)